MKITEQTTLGELQAYLCDQAAAFNTMWRALDNELALRIKLMEKPR